MRPTPRNASWAAVVLLAAALAATSVYGQRQEERRDARIEAVSLYIREVNAVRAGLAEELDDLGRTYRQFASGPRGLANAAPRFEATVETMERLRERLAALEPPPEARALHAEIAKLVELEAALAKEVRDLGVALPKMAKETRTLAAAGRGLLTDLRKADTVALQATAFDRYGRTLQGAVNRLSRLGRPAALGPSVESEVKRLRNLVRLAKRTRDALAAENAADAVRLSNQLAKAASQSAVVTESQREGVEAYGRRIERIGAQKRAVERARERVAASL